MLVTVELIKIGFLPGLRFGAVTITCLSFNGTIQNKSNIQVHGHLRR